ncbi:MAG: hypothetical protein Q4F65_11400 [Propionibacteriaceae bacterium]|nr:hypothetical protein [Propionibacteriaceae bacterium]
MDLWDNIGITAEGAVAVVVSSVVLYVAFATIFRLWGARLLGGRSALTFAIATGLGAIVARASLGHSPTMAGGLIAVATLLGMEALTSGWFRGRFGFRGHDRAAVVMVGGQIQRRQLLRHGIGEAHLWELLRRRGIHGPDEVGVVVLESNGGLSHLSPGRPIDPRILTGVSGRDLIPAEWFTTDPDDPSLEPVPEPDPTPDHP